MTMMSDEKLLQNADFLEIAMEQMDEESVEYEFVADVCANLTESARES